MRTYRTFRQWRRRPIRRRTAFTLIELLVVVAIIALLISILLPSLSRAKRQSTRAVCQSNLRQQILATMMYAQEEHDRYPVGKNFEWEKYTYFILARADYIQDILIPYLGGEKSENLSNEIDEVAFSQVFRCPDVIRNPADEWLLDPVHSHYRYNTHKAMIYTADTRRVIGRATSTVEMPVSSVVLFEYAWPDWTEDMFPHQLAKAEMNAAYADGHVSSLTAAKYLEASPEKEYEKEPKNPFISNGWDGVFVYEEDEGVD